MNTSEFKSLARSGDFKKVMVTCQLDSRMVVSAQLRCEDESDDLSSYNYLRDDQGEVVNFDSADEALTLIHMFGYKGEITVIDACEKVA